VNNSSFRRKEVGNRKKTMPPECQIIGKEKKNKNNFNISYMKLEFEKGK